MSKYHWSIDDLIKRKEFFEKLLKKEENKDRKANLMYDILVIENTLDDHFAEKENSIKLLDIYGCLKEYLIDYLFLWDDIVDFYSSIDINSKFVQEQRSNYSKEDILTLTHDFYHSLGGVFYKKFLKLFKDRRSYVRFDAYNDNDYGETIFLKTTRECFMIIERCNTVEDILTSIHEYGHSISYLMNPSNNNREIFIEIDSIFMELAAHEFLKKKTHDKNLSIIKANEFKSIYNMSSRLNSIFELIEREMELGRQYKSNKDLRTYASNPRIVPNLLQKTHRSQLGIIISYLFSLELYYMYLNDKEKSLETLKQIIIDDFNDMEQYYSNIKRLGLIPNQSILRFQNDLKRENETLTKKKRV